VLVILIRYSGIQITFMVDSTEFLQSAYECRLYIHFHHSEV